MGRKESKFRQMFSSLKYRNFRLLWLGGFVVGALGVKYALLLNTISFVAVLWALYVMEIPQVVKNRGQSIMQSLKDGTVYMANHKTILTVVLFSFIMVAIGLPYTTLLPVFAKDYFHLEAAGYGYLFSIAGVGALAGSMFSGLRSKEKVKKAMILSFICFGASLLAFGILAAIFPNIILIFALLLISIGFCLSTFNATNNTILQLQVDNAYRGRVLSTLFLGFGLTSLGSFVMGWVAEYFSAPSAYIIIGALLLVLSGFLVYHTKEQKLHEK